MTAEPRRARRLPSRVLSAVIGAIVLPVVLGSGALVASAAEDGAAEVGGVDIHVTITDGPAPTATPAPTTTRGLEPGDPGAETPNTELPSTGFPIDPGPAILLLAGGAALVVASRVSRSLPRRH